MIDDFPQDFIFNGKTYTGTRGELVHRNTLQPGGFQEDYDLGITIGLEKRVKVSPWVPIVWEQTFATEPNVRDTVTVGEVIYRVMTTSRDPLAVGIRMDLDTTQI